MYTVASLKTVLMKAKQVGGGMFGGKIRNKIQPVTLHLKRGPLVAKRP